MDKQREVFLENLCTERPYRLVLSDPADKMQEFRKIKVQLIQGSQGLSYQLEKLTDRQAFHINIEVSALYEALQTYFGIEYLQLSAWTKDWEYQGRISKKGKLLSNRRRNTEQENIRQGNNEEKNYCIPEGQPIPPLIDMGIFTKEGKIVKSKYDKYRQINRYLELVEDVWKELPQNEEIHIVDFGCGKSYLTFLLYYYLVEVKKRQVTITGLDLKEEVIENCQQTAKKYGYNQLRFQCGDISEYQSEERVHMVISLHACDTATDYAIYHAIQWNSQVILSVPCCQHELNQQMGKESFPILSRYGIIKERTAALMTDAIRGNLLEHSGYRTQLLEFIDMEHSPKNILIRAVQTRLPEERKQKAMEEAEELMDTFGFQPTLYQLLQGGEGKNE